MFSIQTLIFGVEVVVGILLAVLYLKSRLPKETIDQQAKLITALEKRIVAMETDYKDLFAKHGTNEKKIATLEGQVSVYKELPLQDIAKSLKALENLPGEFRNIQKENTKVIVDAVHNVQAQNVKLQTVENETVRSKT